MRRPGDDGYRTPTIEDAERRLSNDNEGNSFFPPAERKARDVHTSALEALHNPAYRVSEASSAANNAVGQDEDAESDVARSHLKYPDSLPIHLSWKKRIRHFTWAFFTLTMATGGIANVLYTSKYHPPGISIPMLTTISSLQIPGLRYHWGCSVSIEHCSLYSYLVLAVGQVLFLSLYISSITFASDGIVVRPGIYRFIWNDPDQHLSIWPRAHRPLALPCSRRSVLDRCDPCSYLFCWDISSFV